MSTNDKELMKESIRDFFKNNIPFTQKVGIEVVDIDQGLAKLRMPFVKYNQNHVGTVHAGAEFTLAESASGAAAIATFSDILTSSIFLVSAASIKFKSLGEGDLEAVAKIPREIQDKVRGELKQKDDKTHFTIPVTVYIEGSNRVVAEVELQWYMKAL